MGTLEACGSLRSLSKRAFEACRKECQDRCKARGTGQSQRPKSNNQKQNKLQQRKQGSGRSQSQVRQKQQRNQSKQGCPGGGSAADCALEACGSLRTAST